MSRNGPTGPSPGTALPGLMMAGHKKGRATMKNQKLWREIRHISADNLRRLCIHQRWYTKGDNAAYNHLLIDLAENKKNLTTRDIIEIAEDIAAHSDLSEVEPECDIVACIAYEVAGIATTSFRREEG